VPPHTWGAPTRHVAGGPVPRPLTDDAELHRILTGNLLWSGWAVSAALVAALLGLLLPGVLCAMAAAPGTADTSRSAQVAWAVTLFVSYAVAVAMLAGTGSRVGPHGITTRSCWRRHRVCWSDVQAFLPHASGMVVLTRSGRRVTAAVRLAGKAGQERSARDAAYLNGTFGLGVPLRVCLNCEQQFFEARPGTCRYHPASPVCLGTVGEGGQRRSWWMYQCCWLVALAPIGEDGRELPPPVTGGCRVGAHVAPDWVVPESPVVESSILSWAREPEKARDVSSRQPG
jgi:hypothetical protein